MYVCCACILSSQTNGQAELSTSGGYPIITFLWRSTSQNGRVTSCRGGVVRLSQNVGIRVGLVRGMAYSDNRRQTSWSMFNTFHVAEANSLMFVTYPNLVTVINEPVSMCHNYLYLFVTSTKEVAIVRLSVERITQKLWTNFDKVFGRGGTWDGWDERQQMVRFC